MRRINHKVEYISLKEATKYCRYSQDYLKLRARQGKLKAVKIGRNWATTREWIEEYLNCNKRTYKKTYRRQPPVSFPRGIVSGVSNFQFLNIFVRLVLGLTIVLIIIGIFLNWEVFGEYFQWQIASLGKILNKGLSIIPARVVNIR